MIPSTIFLKWCDCLCRSSVSTSKSSYCPNPYCSELILDECGETTKKSTCPRCKRLFCFDCRVPWHAGFWCTERSQRRDANDVRFGLLLERMKWTRCPYCGQSVERTEGCRNVRCRYAFSALWMVPRMTQNSKFFCFEINLLPFCQTHAHIIYYISQLIFLILQMWESILPWLWLRDAYRQMWKGNNGRHWYTSRIIGVYFLLLSSCSNCVMLLFMNIGKELTKVTNFIFLESLIRCFSLYQAFHRTSSAHSFLRLAFPQTCSAHFDSGHPHPHPRFFLFSKKKNNRKIIGLFVTV